MDKTKRKYQLQKRYTLLMLMPGRVIIVQVAILYIFTQGKARKCPQGQKKVASSE
jgi:hypothetical protein